MSTQIAVKLPDEVVSAVDRLVEEGAYDSRSQAVRSALDRLLRESRSRRIDEAFRQGFQRRPDRPEEVADATRLAIDAIHDEPWEPWW